VGRDNRALVVGYEGLDVANSTASGGRGAKSDAVPLLIRIRPGNSRMFSDA
jgi:hypothetical protein